MLWKCLIISACVSGNSFSTWTHQCTRQETPKVLFHLSPCQQSSDSFLACYKSLNHIIVLPNTEGRESTEMNISFSTMVTIIFRLYPGEILKPRAKKDLIEYRMLCRVIFQHLAECVSPSQSNFWSKLHIIWSWYLSFLQLLSSSPYFSRQGHKEVIMESPSKCIFSTLNTVWVLFCCFVLFIAVLLNQQFITSPSLRNYLLKVLPQWFLT